MFDLNINLVINSNKEIFVFQLSNEGKVIYSVYDSSLTFLDSNNLDDKRVLKYTTCIDESNTVHLVALIHTGELYYYKYSDQNWSKVTIAKFDMKSNLYNQIEILIIKNRLHIIYNYSNLINSNVWTIQHVIYGSEEKHNAIRYISKRVPDPFIVDVDTQGTIHLLYKNNINNPQINHSFYSPYTKSWSSLTKQVSSDNRNSSLPFLFIDPQDNMHGLWQEDLDGNYQIKYIRMSSSGKEKYIWKDIQLPYIQLSKYPPIIFEEDNILKLVFLSGDSINFIYSTDYGSSWIKDSNNEVLSDDVILVKTKSILNKVNYIYCNSFDNPKLFFLDLFSYKKPLSVEGKPIVEYEETIVEPIEIQNIIPNEFEDKLNNILDNYNSIDSILNQLLDSQKSIEDKLNNIQNSIDSKKPSFLNRLFN